MLGSCPAQGAPWDPTSPTWGFQVPGVLHSNGEEMWGCRGEKGRWSSATHWCGAELFSVLVTEGMCSVRGSQAQGREDQLSVPFCHADLEQRSAHPSN